MVGGVAVVAELEEDEVPGLGGLPPDPLVVASQVVPPQPCGRPPGRVLHAGLVPDRHGGGLRAPVLVEAPGQEHRTPRGMVVAAHGGLPVLGVVVLRVTLGLAGLPTLVDRGGQQLVRLGVLRPDQRRSGTGGWRAPSAAGSERTGARSGQQCPSADRVAPYCPFGCQVDSLGLATVRRCSCWSAPPQVTLSFDVCSPRPGLQLETGPYLED